MLFRTFFRWSNGITFHPKYVGHDVLYYEISLTRIQSKWQFYSYKDGNFILWFIVWHALFHVIIDRSLRLYNLALDFKNPIKVTTACQLIVKMKIYRTFYIDLLVDSLSINILSSFRYISFHLNFNTFLTYNVQPIESKKCIFI